MDKVFISKVLQQLGEAKFDFDGNRNDELKNTKQIISYALNSLKDFKGISEVKTNLNYSNKISKLDIIKTYLNLQLIIYKNKILIENKDKNADGEVFKKGFYYFHSLLNEKGKLEEEISKTLISGGRKIDLGILTTRNGKPEKNIIDFGAIVKMAIGKPLLNLISTFSKIEHQFAQFGMAFSPSAELMDKMLVIFEKEYKDFNSGVEVPTLKLDEFLENVQKFGNGAFDKFKKLK